MATKLQEINNNSTYFTNEQLLLAIPYYHMPTASHKQVPTNDKRPVISEISKLDDLSETTLKCHIRNPGPKTITKIPDNQQLSTITKEKVLIEWLLFLDDFNITVNCELL